MLHLKTKEVAFLSLRVPFHIPTENKLTLFREKGENEYLIAASPLKKGVNECEFRL